MFVRCAGEVYVRCMSEEIHTLLYHSPTHSLGPHSWHTAGSRSQLQRASLHHLRSFSVPR